VRVGDLIHGKPAYLWAKEEVAIDVFHHLVYATATALAYERLDRRTDA
jgi:hypothetical protein